MVIGQCPSNYAKNGFGTCESLKGALAWFPFLICTIVLFAVAWISKCVDRDSLLISNFLVLMGGLELIIYLVFMIQGFLWGSIIIGVLVFLALLGLIIQNLIWCLVCYKGRVCFD